MNDQKSLRLFRCIGKRQFHHYLYRNKKQIQGRKKYLLLADLRSTDKEGEVEWLQQWSSAHSSVLLLVNHKKKILKYLFLTLFLKSKKKWAENSENFPSPVEVWWWWGRSVAKSACRRSLTPGQKHHNSAWHLSISLSLLSLSISTILEYYFY